MSVFKDVQFRDWAEENGIVVDVNTYEKIYTLWQQMSTYKKLYYEWLDKTEFIQDMMNDGRLSGQYLGLHRADVCRSLIERLYYER